MNRFSADADQIAVDVTETPTADDKIPTFPPPHTASQRPVLAGDRLTEVYANGRRRMPIAISNGTASLLVDTEVREEGADLLARSAVACSRRPV